MVYGLIISAGNQSRFESAVPKALMKYGNKTLLDENLHNMKQFCDEVFVVCSVTNHDWFTAYPLIIISSGKGCGDAVLQALQTLNIRDGDTVFIQWGDCLHTPIIYEKVLQSYCGRCVIPCIEEHTPYVQVLPESDNTVQILFSKYGEKTSHGYHDLSLFYGNAKSILTHLENFARNILVDGKYIHKHGNELQFLDVFNETSLEANIIELIDYKTFSFNTLDEFKQLTIENS